MVVFSAVEDERVVLGYKFALTFDEERTAFILTERDDDRFSCVVSVDVARALDIVVEMDCREFKGTYQFTDTAHFFVDLRHTL